MKFANLQKVSNTQFRRLTGVKRETFQTMVAVFTESDKAKKAKGGRPNKMSIETRILMALEYWREYRTYAHIGISYGVSESSAFQTVRAVENALIKSGKFALPGKKSLLKSDVEYEVILIDATETPIERPKKNKENFILARKKDILSKLNSL